MVQWQFLIQKEGDQEWLPLEVSHAEILEGRYRLAAQAEAPMQQIVIQIHHEYDIDGIPQQTTQRRCQHADAQGQLALLPLSFVAPGFWEFTCFPTGEANHNANLSLQTLTLQVLAQDEGLLSDWEPFDGLSGQLSGLSLVEVHIPYEAPAALPPTPEKRILQNAVPDPGTRRVAPPILVSLPEIPKGCPEIPLHVSLGFRMPPQLYFAQEDIHSGESSPQLPTFLPMSLGLYQSISAPAAACDLEGLRQMAATVDPQVTQTAFDALTQRQCFWETLNALALTSDPSGSSVQ
jgi:hypothetical protein